MSKSSYKAILRSSSIIGGSELAVIFSAIVKMKVVAILIGPVGIGVAGLYLSLVQTSALIASLGVGKAGARQIAKANSAEVPKLLNDARLALLTSTLLLATIGGACFWVSKKLISDSISLEGWNVSDLTWLSVGVVITVIVSSQTAVLNGLRRIPDIAYIKIITGIFSAVVGIFLIYSMGSEGIVWMVLIGPAVSLILGGYYLGKLDQPLVLKAGLSDLICEWSSLFKLGFSLMLAAVVALIGLLVVRGLVLEELGPEALGQFQASWSVGVIYLGFVLAAMGTDFYPRLTALIEEPEKVRELVNEQTEVGLLLCGPVLVVMMGAAPMIITLLYSSEFGQSAEVLRWHLMGDIFKVVSWPLGFVLMAANAGKTFLFVEAFGIAVFVLGVFFLLPALGLVSTGYASMLIYIVYLPIVRWLVGNRLEFYWTNSVKVQGLFLFAIASLVHLASYRSETLGLAFGFALGSGMAVWSFVRLSALAEFSANSQWLTHSNNLVKRVFPWCWK